MRPLAGILMAGTVTLLVFYLLNPGWWDAPLETARDVLSERSELLQRQAGVYGGYQSLGQQAKGFFSVCAVSRRSRNTFEDGQWAGYAEISEQIQIYEGSGWAGATHRRQCARGAPHAIGACCRRYYVGSFAIAT